MNRYKFCEIENNPTITKIHTAFSQHLEPDFRFHGETHYFWELLCVLNGEIQVAADHRVFTLKKGEAILHSPMQFHNISCFSGEADIIVFSFDGNNIPPLQNKVCKISDKTDVKLILKLANYYYIFENIIPLSPKQKGCSHLEFIKNLELLLVKLTPSEFTSTRAFTKSAENYSIIIKTLDEHLYERLSVNDIARLCNMSEIGLQKTFSKYAGMGIMEYFNLLKIYKAQVLLNEGNSVKETALKLGFQDPNYFSTVFKRFMGVSPKAIQN